MTPSGDAPDLPEDTGQGDIEFVSSETPAPGGGLPLTQGYDPNRTRESIRSGLAIGLTVLLAVVVLAVVGATVFGDYPVAEAKELLSVVLAPLVALVGAATGFYYGGKD